MQTNLRRADIATGMLRLGIPTNPVNIPGEGLMLARGRGGLSLGIPWKQTNLLCFLRGHSCCKLFGREAFCSGVTKYNGRNIVGIYLFHLVRNVA